MRERSPRRCSSRPKIWERSWAARISILRPCVVLSRPVGYTHRMHQTLGRRLLAMVLAVWFTAYAVEPAALVGCPMHGGTAMAEAGHGMAGSSARHSGTGHEAHRAHAAGTANREHGSSR